MKLTKKLGLLQVYTGDGKGKTTASLGLALRAIGHGMKVCMIQFMKNSDIYGEVRLAEKMPGLTIIPVGRHDFVNLKNPAAIDVRRACNIHSIVLYDNNHNFPKKFKKEMDDYKIHMLRVIIPNQDEQQQRKVWSI